MHAQNNLTFQDRLTHVQVLFTWNHSPLQFSKLSFEYVLLPPRSAIRAVSLRITSQAASQTHAPPYAVWPLVLPQWPGISHPLERHPFSGLVHSAGELLHIP